MLIIKLITNVSFITITYYPGKITIIIDIKLNVKKYNNNDDDTNNNNNENSFITVIFNFFISSLTPFL